MIPPLKKQCSQKNRGSIAQEDGVYAVEPHINRSKSSKELTVRKSYQRDLLKTSNSKSRVLGNACSDRLKRDQVSHNSQHNGQSGLKLESTDPKTEIIIAQFSMNKSVESSDDNILI